MDFIEEYQNISRSIMRLSRAIVSRSLLRQEQSLQGILNRYLPMDETSEYVYIFMVCYGGVRGERFRRIKKISAAINLLQASTFIIDDVLDESTMRYDEATIWSEYGTGTGITSGHLMETIAVETMINQVAKEFPSQSFFVLRTVNEIIKDVYRGQNLDIALSGSRNLSLFNYKRMIGFTTGNFFKAVARLGWRLGKRNNSVGDALERFAYWYGMALQVSDDIIDIEGSPILTGKDFAVDLKKMRPRLPIILGLQTHARKDLTKLLFSLRAGDNGLKLQAIRALLEKSGAIEKCIGFARRYVKNAQDALRGLPKGQMRERFEALLGNLLRNQLLE